MDDVFNVLIPYDKYIMSMGSSWQYFVVRTLKKNRIII